nr:hypothetical protein [Candidatus Sigynarchaeota archaeon]
MVVAVQKQAEPAIRVDESRKYRVSAGQCEKCGYFKTWDFKIVNPKSGKGLPGHVTKEGFKINDGDCPFYALLKAKTEAKEPAVQEEAPAQVVQAPATPVAPKKATQPPATKAALTFSGDGNTIIATIGACSATLSRDSAIKACRDLLTMVVE